MDLQAKSCRRVLVVDDDRTMRVLLSAFLRAAGHEVEVAAGGEEALALLASAGPPDLVLLDYMMNGMSGPEVLRRMRAEPRMDDVPILMLTGMDRDARVEEALLAGADGYLRKPVERRSLLARVEVALQGRAALGSGTA